MTDVAPDPLTGTYVLDPSHSRIGFVARHAMITKVRGSFNEVDGSGFFDAANPEHSNLALTTEAARSHPRREDRGNHLRSNGFFGREKYPESTFRSTQVEAKGDSVYPVTGDLTMKDVTKSI